MRPMKLADALPLPVSSTVKMGGALDGLVTGLSRYPFITAVKVNGTSTRVEPSGERRRGRGDRSSAERHVRDGVGDAFDDSGDGAVVEPR